MSLKSIATYCVALFVIVFGLLSPAFAQEESKTHELQLTIKWPAAASDQIYVLLMPGGGNCGEIMQANAEESEAYDAAHGQLYGGLTWMTRSNVNIKIGVGGVFTLCTYEKQGGRFIYVPLSVVLNMPYQPAYEYTPILPPAPPLQLTVMVINSPQGSKVVLWDGGGACPEKFTKPPAFAYDYASTTWPVPVNLDGGIISAGLYAKLGDDLQLVPDSCRQNIVQQSSYTMQVDLPAPATMVASVKPPHAFEATSTVLIGTTVFPGWSRLTPLVGFMVVPRSMQLGTSQFALKPIVYGTFLVDNPSTGGTVAVTDLGAGALVGVQTNRKVQLHGDAGLMLGYGPAVWGCSSNTVSNPDDLRLNCQPGDGAITLRQQAWWFAPTLALSVDVPVGKEGLRFGFGVTSQVRIIKGYEMMPNSGELEVEVVASDGNTYTAHYQLANKGWLIVLPIIPAIKFVFP